MGWNSLEIRVTFKKGSVDYRDTLSRVLEKDLWAAQALEKGIFSQGFLRSEVDFGGVTDSGFSRVP